ncbi:DNA-binding protein [Streptomyces sp. Ru71]|uniref:helix-turn-helix domain-containing protein n=1 Tax=Streptomyces sp. Ru71 TaxID=2080746 RepID=UPI000CDDFB34|nr:pyridoxamine 5'-phosphate oxidase family protein [Streptomyces sp. Ru71]POX57386.1 DNA-binding protein [Streptomyces sp. Ru71]
MDRQVVDRQVAPAPVREAPLGDLGRRIAQRRTRLGLAREEVAARAGMSAAYVRHLEEHPAAAPGPSALLRLAGALETTVTELAGGTAELPEGLGKASRTAELVQLGAEECRTLLGTHGVGRLAVLTTDGLVIVPVNYSVVDGAIVFRTDPRATPGRAAGRRVAFEVDRIDEAFSSGWSVLVQGRARTVTDPDEARRLTERVYSKPWAGGRRTLWMRIDPVGMTGRRIAV